jgi:hypothetical protein
MRKEETWPICFFFETPGLSDFTISTKVSEGKGTLFPRPKLGFWLPGSPATTCQVEPQGDMTI